MITYPLNNIEYSAEDAELFHATRTSGVYANNSFNYSLIGGNDIEIGSGIAWIKNSEFAGKVVAEKKPTVINMGITDAVYPRIDAVVIQFNAETNETTFVVKQGALATDPVAPEVVRTSNIYELHLYHILRPAGAVSLSAADITDMRLLPEYCGIMADSVTSVDATAIQQQIDAFIENARSQTSSFIYEARSETQELISNTSTAVKNLANETEQKYNEAQDDIDKLISDTEERLDDIAADVKANVETDDTVATVKSVPENSLPYAEVVEIGGMTRKCAQLIPFPYIAVNGTSYGVTYTINQNGTISLSGKATSGFTIVLCEKTLSTGSYYLADNCSATGVNFIAYDIDAGEVLSYEGTFTLTKSTKVRVYYLISVGFDGAATVYPMLNAGTTALPYEPYFEGLRSAKVTEVKSVGVNVLPFPYNQSIVTNNGVTYTVNADGSVLANGTATEYTNAVIYLARNFVLPAGTYTFVFNDTGIQGAVMAVMINGAWFADVSTYRTITLKDGDALTIYLQVVGGVSVTNLLLKPRINRGDTAQHYTPYIKHTLPILPEEVRPANGINENVYDYIEWAEDGSVKQGVRCGVVDLGTLVCSDTSYPNTFRVSVPNIKNPDSALSRADGFLIDCYDASTNVDYTNIDDKSAIRYQGNILIRDSDFTDATSFKAAMSGVMIVYELAEPVITDISDLLPADNLLPVEGGGTVTMVNEYGYDVPNTVVFYEGTNAVIGADTFVGDLVGTASRAICDSEGNKIDQTYLKQKNLPSAMPPTAHNQAASTITAGTFAGQVVANASGQPAGVSCVRNSKYSFDESVLPTVEGESVWYLE